MSMSKLINDEWTKKKFKFKLKFFQLIKLEKVFAFFAVSLDVHPIYHTAKKRNDFDGN